MTLPQASLQSSVAFLRRILALTDRYLDGNSKILDFGCGAGEFVYLFRDAGFDARGFDIHDYLQLRSPDDRQYFDIAETGSPDRAVMTVDWSRYHLPYDNDTFDFVLSNQTLEHVLNLDAVVSELARITKQDGIGIHIFPSRYRLLEAHTYVPFGGMTKSFYYNLFWAILGVRNQFQKGLSAIETARLNVKYAHTGTRYPAVREIQQIGRKYFEGAYFAPQLRHTAWGPACVQGRKAMHMIKAVQIAITLFSEIFWILECPKDQNRC
jgi:SAM-dependent methyltransferase